MSISFLNATDKALESGEKRRFLAWRTRYNNYRNHRENVSGKTKQ